MSFRLALASWLLLAVGHSGAFAQSANTVQSLMKDGYAVVGVVSSQVGPGIFLHKGDALMLCFVAEKPNSQAVETQYCKPVR
jgi:hypothetical protein